MKINPKEIGFIGKFKKIMIKIIVYVHTVADKISGTLKKNKDSNRSTDRVGKNAHKEDTLNSVSNELNHENNIAQTNIN